MGKPEEAPPSLKLIMGGLSKEVRPTFVALVTFGAMIGGAFWLDARARAYIVESNRVALAPLEQRISLLEKIATEADARERTLEASMVELRADSRATREDVRYLRERADRMHR